jgi:hypothetical protein
VCSQEHRCVVCTMDSDCPTATPHCRMMGPIFGRAPACVQCTMNSECPAATPTCSATGVCGP